MSKPKGVCASAAVTIGPVARPFAPTVKVSITLAVFSVTTRAQASRTGSGRIWRLIGTDRHDAQNETVITGADVASVSALFLAQRLERIDFGRPARRHV